MCFRPSAVHGSKVCDVCKFENLSIAVYCKECGAELSEEIEAAESLDAPKAPGAQSKPKPPGPPSSRPNS